MTLLGGSLDEYWLKGHCLVSEGLANRAFNGDAIGKPITITYFDEKIESLVCGIFKDAENSMVPNTDVLLNPEFDFFRLQLKRSQKLHHLRQRAFRQPQFPDYC